MNDMNICGIDITHPDKILYKKLKLSKIDVAKYYEFIAPFMLPHIKNRPLSLKQYPEGIEKAGFFHKHKADFYPDFLPVFEINMHKTHTTMQMTGTNKAKDLVYLAGQNAIEFHIPTSNIKHIEKPDQIILDLDPSDNDFEKVRVLALLAKEIIEEQNMDCFVKTTGNRGLHIHIPINSKLTYEKIKPISKELAQHIQEQAPELATTEIRKNKRGKNVFIDYLRNDYAMTAIAPYSLRANVNAGIATPISWEELKQGEIHAQSFTILNIKKRIEKDGCAWKRIL